MANIVVIDDDADIRLLLERFLVKQGHKVFTAPDGKKGLCVMKEVEPELVITDIMMPDTDGLEVLMEIRKQHVDIPVIAVSGGMRALPIDFLTHARMLGARQVFRKPVMLDDLLLAVNQLLNEDSIS